jgi:hypothetical protein
MQFTTEQYEHLALNELGRAEKIDRSDVPNALHVQRALVYAVLALASVRDQPDPATPVHDD